MANDLVQKYSCLPPVLSQFSALTFAVYTQIYSFNPDMPDCTYQSSRNNYPYNPKFLGNTGNHKFAIFSLKYQPPC